NEEQVSGWRQVAAVNRPVKKGARARADDRNALGYRQRGLGGAPSQSESSGTIGVTAGRAGRAVDHLPRVGHRAVERVKVFANVPARGDLQFAVFESGAQAGKELGFEGGRELAEFEVDPTTDFVCVFRMDVRKDRASFRQFLLQIIAKADPWAG